MRTEMRSFASSLALIVLCTAALLESTSAWSAPASSSSSSRRGFLQTAAAGITLTIATAQPAIAAPDSSMMEELKMSAAKLEPIPALLENKEWDAVRTILKTPPVNKLWNLGDVSSRQQEKR